jgi:hypothetical protein
MNLALKDFQPNKYMDHSIQKLFITTEYTDHTEEVFM